jgi:cell wall-associated NlpC family hydrolase
LLAVLASPSCRVRTEQKPEPVLRRQIAGLAVSLAGIPYRFGGIDIDGFDCSGLVCYVYGCFGIIVPRSARDQGRLPGTVKLQHAAPGDILIFRLGRIWHSAIYLGDGRFIHAPSSGGWVRFEKLDAFWLSKLRRIVSARPHGR